MILFLIFFFLIAAVYSSQDLGGIPTLIAMLVLLPFSAYETKILALVLSCLVVILMLINHQLSSMSKLTDAVLILIAAVPSVFLGAMIQIPEKLFFFLLGCAFLLSALFIWVQFKADGRKNNHKGGLLTGSAIVGFFTGLTGMSGSILLLPLLQKYNWKENDEMALFSSIFVIVTSFLTLFSTYKSGAPFDWKLISLYSGAVLLGSLAGRRIEISYLNPVILKNITSLFLLIFGMVLIYNYGGFVVRMIKL
jgi:uncharacterized membrane protein YfcA